MKHYTTIEQSKKLLELGLSPESADMYFSHHDEKYYIIHKDCPYPFLLRDKIPCWSLGALLEVMPTPHTGDGDAHPFIAKASEKEYYIVYATIDKEINSSNIYKTPLEAAYNMVVWLLENGYSL